MNAGLIDRFETGTEQAAAALFGGAVGFAAYGCLRFALPQPQLVTAVVAAGLFSFFLSGSWLRAAARRDRAFAVSIFDVRDFEELGFGDELFLTSADQLDPSELLLTEEDRAGSEGNCDELLLTDSDRLMPAAASKDAEPLLLDDILAEMGPGSRVVRLFDPKAMLTPGQLKSRIDSHLEQGTAPTAPSDASQALSAALAELRRSLR